MAHLLYICGMYMVIDSRGYGVIFPLQGWKLCCSNLDQSYNPLPVPPFLMMMLGAGIFAVGFHVWHSNRFVMFVIAAIIVCIGEMFYFPN